MGIELDRRRLADSGAEPGIGYHARTRREGASQASRTNGYTGTLAYSDRPENERRGSLLDRAIAHVRRCLPELDPEHGAPAEFTACPQVTKTAAGERIVHLEQHIHGVPIFRAVRTVRFDRAGDLLDVVGDHVPCRSDEVDLSATLGAAEAVLRAAQHLADPKDGPGLAGLRISNRRPRVVGAFPLPGAPTLVHKPPFASPILVRQVLFFERPRLRLCWLTPLWLPELFEQYDVLVAANGDDSGEIVFCRSGVVSSHRALATLVNPDDSAPALFDLPIAPSAYPGFALRPLPKPWVAAKSTEGNNAKAVWKSRVIKSTDDGGGGQRFDPSDALPAATVNAFVLANYLHDFFYLLGFDERAGALQEQGPTGLGHHEDALFVRVVGDAVEGIARTVTKADGVRVEMKLGQVRSNLDGVTRHSGFDAHVLIHEYTHAVVARRVGPDGLWRPLNGGSAQAQAMDEGFGDFFGVTLGNFLRRQAGLPETLVYGGWVVGDAVNGQRRYDGPLPNFEDLAQRPEPHDGGAIWCRALLHLHERFGGVLGSVDRADLAAWLLVFDALPSFPIGQGGPDFLAGRDALLRTFESWRAGAPPVASGPAATLEEVDRLELAVRETFADLGMGAGAVSVGGTLVGLVNDFTV
jgi:extracellular elastinolytic metalloproteinase